MGEAEQNFQKWVKKWEQHWNTVCTKEGEVEWAFVFHSTWQTAWKDATSCFLFHSEKLPR